MRVDVYTHPTNRELAMANEVLQSQLSAVVSVLSSKDSIIASLSSAGDSSTVASEVSAAVDAEDNDIAASISSILSA